jgi:hypothetical protein
MTHSGDDFTSANHFSICCDLFKIKSICSNDCCKNRAAGNDDDDDDNVDVALSC